MNNDLIAAQVMEQVSLSVAVANAHPLLHKHRSRHCAGNLRSAVGAEKSKSRGCQIAIVMSKNLRWTTALLGSLVLVLIGCKLVDADLAPVQAPIHTSEPTYQSEYTTTVVYNQVGGLNYRLVADHVNYYAEQQITWFTRPVATTFDEDKVPTWTVKAYKAKLTQDRMLYLYGHVQIDSLTDASQLKRITTDNAVVNLVTQDVSSDNEVILYGAGFNSTGMKMRGNLRNKTAELIEKVKTSYEIQNLQRTP